MKKSKRPKKGTRSQAPRSESTDADSGKPKDGRGFHNTQAGSGEEELRRANLAHLKYLTPASLSIGAPTLYRPEYCQDLLDWCAEGRSFKTFAAKVGVWRETLYDWAKKYPDFDHAKKRGAALAEAFWETVMRNGATGNIKGYREATPIFIAKARFGYRENGDNTDEQEDVDVKWTGR